MAHSQDTSPSMPELMTRIAVTLGVLAVYRLGTHLPLAGINQTALANLLAGIDQAALANLGSAFTGERVSIFALGVTPIISALLVVEVARLASERRCKVTASPLSLSGLRMLSTSRAISSRSMSWRRLSPARLCLSGSRL